MSTPHDDKYQDWLILSHKHSGDELVWYASGYAGYTKNLLYAGRYTELKAKQEAARCGPDGLMAVHLRDAMSMALTWVTVANGTDAMDELKTKVESRNRKERTS